MVLLWAPSCRYRTKTSRDPTTFRHGIRRPNLHTQQKPQTMCNPHHRSTLRLAELRFVSPSFFGSGYRSQSGHLQGAEPRVAGPPSYKFLRDNMNSWGLATCDKWGAKRKEAALPVSLPQLWDTPQTEHQQHVKLKEALRAHFVQEGKKAAWAKASSLARYHSTGNDNANPC